MIMIILFYIVSVLIKWSICEGQTFRPYFVDIADVPFVVLIKIKTDILSSICTGSIIAEEWVLTAAHCISTTNINDVQVIAGMDDMENTNDVQVRQPIKIVFHPHYRKIGYKFKWDIVLLQVPKFEMTSKKVGIIKLGSRIWPQDETTYNRSCTILSWKKPDLKTENNTRLHSMLVSAAHGNLACDCLQSHQKKRLICLTQKLGITGICFDDSGGPLICDGEHYGVAHYIYDTYTCTLSDPNGDFELWNRNDLCKRDTAVAAYIYICPELDWIHKYVKTTPKTPQSCKASVQFGLAKLIGLMLIFSKIIR